MPTSIDVGAVFKLPAFHTLLSVSNFKTFPHPTASALAAAAAAASFAVSFAAAVMGACDSSARSSAPCIFAAKKVAKDIDPVRAARFVQVENALRMIIDLQVAGELPLFVAGPEAATEGK